MTNQDTSRPSMSRQTDCEMLRDLLPAYTIGATDPEETALVESLLDSCPEVIDELGEYRSLSRALLFSAPDAAPPANLHDRIMAAAQPRPTVSQQPNVIAPDFSEPPKRSRINRWLALAAGAAAALLLISNLYWISRVSQYEQMQTEIITLLSQQRDLLAATGTGNVQRVELVSTQNQSPDATVLYGAAGELGLLYSDQFPALSPDQTYQLWLIQGEQPVSAGLFQVDQAGRSWLMFRTAQPIESYDAIAVSTEPASGSEQPTTAPVAVGELS